MRVAHILVEGASEYERKHHRIDSVEAVAAADADLIHLYAPSEFPAAAVQGLRVPYVASGKPRQSIFRRVPEPAAIAILAQGVVIAGLCAVYGNLPRNRLAARR